MLAKVLTCAVVGLDGALVDVEIDIGPGLPPFGIVGLPAAAIQEARERVRSAIRAFGLEQDLRLDSAAGRVGVPRSRRRVHLEG